MRITFFSSYRLPIGILASFQSILLLPKHRWTASGTSKTRIWSQDCAAAFLRASSCRSRRKSRLFSMTWKTSPYGLFLPFPVLIPALSPACTIVVPPCLDCHVLTLDAFPWLRHSFTSFSVGLITYSLEFPPNLLPPWSIPWFSTFVFRLVPFLGS